MVATGIPEACADSMAAVIWPDILGGRVRWPGVDTGAGAITRLGMGVFIADWSKEKRDAIKHGHTFYSCLLFRKMARGNSFINEGTCKYTRIPSEDPQWRLGKDPEGGGTVVLTQRQVCLDGWGDAEGEEGAETELFRGTGAESGGRVAPLLSPACHLWTLWLRWTSAHVEHD